MDPTSYTSGERVFGPPNGTFDADWVATALRSVRPELDHATSVRMIERAWGLLRSEDLRGDQLAAALDAEQDMEPGLAKSISAVATEAAELYLDRR